MTLWEEEMEREREFLRSKRICPDCQGTGQDTKPYPCFPLTPICMLCDGTGTYSTLSTQLDEIERKNEEEAERIAQGRS
jgi:hypothetical protein